MKNTTLCYIENPAGEYLMLHRVGGAVLLPEAAL